MNMVDVRRALADLELASTAPVYVETPDGELHEIDEVVVDNHAPVAVIRFKEKVAEV